jgi:hypothetical protein
VLANFNLVVRVTITLGQLVDADAAEQKMQLARRAHRGPVLLAFRAHRGPVLLAVRAHRGSARIAVPFCSRSARIAVSFCSRSARRRAGSTFPTRRRANACARQ